MSENPINVVIPIEDPNVSGEEEKLSSIDEIINYVMMTPHNTNPNILRQMLIALQNNSITEVAEPVFDDGKDNVMV